MTDPTDPRDERAERAFRDALAQQAETYEPLDLDVTPSAGPHRWRTFGVVAAAAVLVGGTAVGLALVDRHAGKGGPAAPTSSGSLPAPYPGWRYESYRDVVVQVPESWTYRALPICPYEGRDDRSPFVDTPMDAVPTIACGDGGPLRMGTWATHLSFGPAEGFYTVPMGTTSAFEWSRIVAMVGHVRLSLLADDAHLAEAQRVLDSARVVEVDQNGCQVSSAVQQGSGVRPAVPFDVMDVTNVERITVCWYDLRTPSGQPGLLGSRVMTGVAARDELAGIQSGTPEGGPNSCQRAGDGDRALVLRLASPDSTHDLYGYYDSCSGNGFDDGTTKRALTRDSCAPLWGERLTYTSGSGGVFRLCIPEEMKGPAD